MLRNTNKYISNPYAKDRMEFIMVKFEKRLIPNYLTILRLILVPIIFGLILYDHYTLAIIFYIIASITDVLDGFIARKYNLISDFGKLMDPLADKVTQIGTILALILKRIIPYWILIILSLKEITMVIVASVLFKKKIVTVHSKWYGKAATVILFVAIVFTLLSEKIIVLSNVTIYLYYLSIAMTLFAGVMYFKSIVCKEF